MRRIKELLRSVGTTCGLVCRHLASSLRSKLTHTGEGKEGERAGPSVAGHALLESSHVAHSFRVTLDSIQFRRRVIRPSQVDYRHSVVERVEKKGHVSTHVSAQERGGGRWRGSGPAASDRVVST